MSEPASPIGPASGSPGAAVREGRAAAGALTFLTGIPVGRGLTIDVGDLARAGPYFPLVGAGIGGLVALVALVVAQAGGALLGAAVGVAFYALITRALHLDAVADTFDALGTRSREDALRVMREPTIGAFGATALFLDLILWTALLATLDRWSGFVPALLVVGAAARLGPVLLLQAAPYVGGPAGLGSAFALGSRSRAAVAVGIVLGLALLVLGLRGLAILVAPLLAVPLMAVAFRRWLGGVTGDSLGTSVEILSLVGLSAVVPLLAYGVL